MADFEGSFFAEDTAYKEISYLDPVIFNSGTVLYEVLRVYSKKCLFLEDHMHRLQESVRLSGYTYLVSIPAIGSIINGLIEKNLFSEGNIKLVLHFTASDRPALFAYFIPHAYPTPEMYSHGVKTDLYKSVRPNPNVKRLWSEDRRLQTAFIRKRHLYEALLVAEDGTITEGSKSNVFFIRGNTVLTPPGDRVLKGITREKIIQLCTHLSIRLIEQSISISRLNEFEAAFLTGTSPKVLPISRIGNCEYQVVNPVMTTLIKAYDDLIACSIRS